jgi:hypothetical protein
MHLHRTIPLAALLAFLSASALAETFTAQRAAIWRGYGKTAAPMQLCINGTCQTIDNIGPIVTNQSQPYYLDLDTISKIEVTPAPARIDTLDAITNALQPGLYASDASAIRYRGSWVHQHREGPSDGEVHSAFDARSDLSFVFEGAGLEVGLVHYDDRRTAKLCIDEACQTINLYGPRLDWQQPLLVYGLKSGRHTASMQLLAGKGMDLDWIRVLPAPEPMRPGHYQPNDKRITTTNNWQNFASTAPRASFAFGFEGRGALLDFTTDADAGEITLCLDGACHTDDLFTLKPGTRQLTLETKSAGLHHVIVHKGPSRRLALPNITIR